MIIAGGQSDVVMSADLNQESGELECNIDMDGRTGADFTVRLRWLTYGDGDDFRYDVRFESTGSGAFVATDDGNVALLEAGTAVNSSSPFRTCGTTGGTILFYVSDDDTSNCQGEWGRPGLSEVATTGYIGVRVQPTAGGFDQFGWIRMTVNWIWDTNYSEPQLIVTVQDWAAETEHLTPIDTGRGPDYADWATREFSDSLPIELRAPDADPDSDGLVNLAEYAFLRDPEGPDDGDPVLKVVREAGSQPILYYQRKSDDPGIAVLIEVSVDFNSWTAIPEEEFEEHIYARIGNSAEFIRAPYVGESADRLFFRLSVVALP